MSVSTVTPYQLININEHQFYDCTKNNKTNMGDDDDDDECIVKTKTKAAAAAASGDYTVSSPCEDDATNKQMMESPQPTASQSTSRLRNAFQRLRGNSVSKVNHIAPAEIIKPTPSKSSLAEKIKFKFQSSTSINHIKNNNKKSLSSTSTRELGGGSKGMIRSTSFSSAWSKWGKQQQNHQPMVRSTSIYHYQPHYQQQQQTQQQQQQKHTKRNNKRKVSFAKLVSVRETFSRIDYDRVSDPYAICNRLTPVIAQQIKEELNAYKLHEMQVHEYSRIHTHFFI